MKDALTRIAIFYDGNFFHVVSNYYAYNHARAARLSISGLHEFVKKRVAYHEHVDVRLCQIVDVHYFRGRFSAQESSEAGKLLAERLFEDVLVREGVTTHYLPMGYAGAEKGIDVWFALEAYELAIYKRLDVCVLVAGDSDYVPLARKLNALGTRVMVLGWDFEYTDQQGRLRTTQTSPALLAEVTYPILVSNLIEDKTQKDLVAELFLPTRDPSRAAAPPSVPTPGPSRTTKASERQQGKIQNLVVREAENKRFGFIAPDAGGENIWFGESDIDDVSFDALQRGDRVSYELGSNWLGACAKHVIRVDPDET
ncbi:MAG TPA: NYN domain-containing protein [Polyangiaceae bacterium]|nr:NYN domain-containing protein [Polyangiaceae bacterium]